MAYTDTADSGRVGDSAISPTRLSLKRTLSSPPEYSHQVHSDNTRQTPTRRRLEDVIPRSHDHRTLVLCFDGTGDQFDEDNSNVVNLFSLLKKDDPSQQLVYYQSGIGTYTIPQIAQPWMAKLHKAADMMVGIHLNAHVMTGYEFLMQNYKIGDKICIFGFSRGAYTARALAGMIHKVGLLPRHNHQQVPFAYKMYTREDETGWRLSTAFKKSFSIDVDIDFMGLWDTVGSVGVIPKRLPFTSSNISVRCFRHALSLDEHRARFIPSLWDHSLPNRQFKKKHLGLRFVESQLYRAPNNGSARSTNNGPAHRSLSQLEREYDVMIGLDADPDVVDQTPTDVQEVWFAGCHCDIGGGAVKNDTRNSLARIPLRWMIRECFKVGTGIMFHEEMLKQVGLDPGSLWPHIRERPPHATASLDDQDRHTSIAGPSSNTLSNSEGQHSANLADFITEEYEDEMDALSPMNDVLKTDPGWWVLEMLPYKVKYQRKQSNDSDEDDGHYSSMGRRESGSGTRHIPRNVQGGIKVHRTVKIRMDADVVALVDSKGKVKGKGKYIPRPKWDFDPVWVD
ncbi:hypothetical protein EV359DRAFT_40394 [Lentinula novae-zelandiae]|nr:hypothetical protein EV359DRAFT_40394 [Lentinula novae-zelandiae]